MYNPSEDSELIAEAMISFIKKEKPGSFLDMGTGSGFLVKKAIENGIKKEDILAADIDEDSLKEAGKLGAETIKSVLFEKIKGKFDLICFNAPYLPEDRYDRNYDTTGGKEGWEIIEKFIKQAEKHLTKEGSIILLFSSLTNKGKVKEIITESGFNFEEAKKKKFFMEELYVLRIFN